MFQHCRLLLEQYYCALLTQGMSKRAEHILHEVRGRLRSLQWLHARLTQLDNELEASERAAIPSDQPTPDVLKLVFADVDRPDCERYTHALRAPEPFDELRALLEAFYYFAHRVSDLLNNGRAELPGMPRFKTPGVRDVRNHLIEHPDRKAGVLVFSIAAGGPVGPQLKPIRWSLDRPGTEDPGLHANAAEFTSLLEQAIKHAIAHSTGA